MLYHDLLAKHLFSQSWSSLSYPTVNKTRVYNNRGVVGQCGTATWFSNIDFRKVSIEQYFRKTYFRKTFFSKFIFQKWINVMNFGVLWILDDTCPLRNVTFRFSSQSINVSSAIFVINLWRLMLNNFQDLAETSQTTSEDASKVAQHLCSNNGITPKCFVKVTHPKE